MSSDVGCIITAQSPSYGADILTRFTSRDSSELCQRLCNLRRCRDSSAMIAMISADSLDDFVRPSAVICRFRLARCPATFRN